MKPVKFKLSLFFVGLILSQNLYSVTYYWQGGSNGNFNTLSNWTDYSTNTSPSSFSNTDEFNYNNNSTVTLNSSIQIKKLIITNGTLNLNGKTLTLTSLAIESPANVSTGSGGKFVYSNANDGELWIYGYSNFNLTEFYYPMKATHPKTLSIRKCTLTLVQDISVKDFFMYPNASNKCYLDLNGYKLTLNRFRQINSPHYEVICHENSEIIFENLTNASSGFRFSTTTGKNKLKSIRKTGSSALSMAFETAVEVTDEIEIQNGAMTSSANVTLLSDSSKTCKIIQGAGGYLQTSGTGKVIAQQYIPGGRRVFRFISNPFNTSLPLSELTDNIDITGNGGSTNGFKNTNTNNASCFYFDAALADNTASGLNPGWQEFTSAITNSWTSSQGILLYVRGALGEGIDGAAYTPSAVTLDISSTTPNYGDKAITLTKGTNSNFISIGNPYLSPIELGNQPSSQRSNLGNNYYVFDANQGTNGGYLTRSFGSSYILPALSGFFTTLTTSGSITFKESDKSTSTGDDVLSGAPSNNRLTLEIFKGNRLYDQTELVLDSSRTLAFDNFDAEKMSNFDLNLYTLSSDAKPLAINYAQFSEGQIIPLGLESTESGEFAFQIPNNSFPADQFKLTLIDAKKGTQTELKTGNIYAFSIDTKDKSTFEQRFAIQIDAIQSTAKMNSLVFSVYPNPTSVNNGINLISNESISKVEILDLQEKLVQKTNCNEQKSVKISFENNLTEGIYLIKVSSKNGVSTQKISVK
jgi:hypothetical protein